MKNTTKKIVVGAAIGAALVLAPVAASAHVGVDADGDAVAGGQATLTFGFNHGCDGSATTGLSIEMPDGLSGVHPIAGAGWAVDIERGGEAGRVSTVTFTAETPIPDAARGEAELLVGFADDAADALAFPVEQVCEDGSIAWSEVAADGEDPHDLDAPAPVLELTGLQDGEAGNAEMEHADAAEHASAEDDSASGGGGAVPLALSGVAVVVSLAALGTSIVRTRRRA